MRLSGAAIFSLGLALVAAYAVYAALRWPPKAALFPLTLGIPLLVLALAQTLVELRDPAAPAQPREARVRDAYPGPTFDRLAAIKARYDPTNLFRLNQNIPPA